MFKVSKTTKETTENSIFVIKSLHGDGYGQMAEVELTLDC